MTRRRAVYRKNNQNKFSMFLVTLVVVVIMVIVAVRDFGIRQKVEANNIRIVQLQQQIAKEEARTEEIEEYGKYTQTMAYKEEVAKDKLGLVYEGEILFKERD